MYSFGGSTNFSALTCRNLISIMDDHTREVSRYFLERNSNAYILYAFIFRQVSQMSRFYRDKKGVSTEIDALGKAAQSIV